MLADRSAPAPAPRRHGRRRRRGAHAVHAASSTLRFARELVRRGPLPARRAPIAAPWSRWRCRATPATTSPRPYEAVLYVASFVLLVLTLSELAQTARRRRPRLAGTFVWVGAAADRLLRVVSRARRNSAIMTLLAALTGVVVVPRVRRLGLPTRRRSRRSAGCCCSARGRADRSAPSQQRDARRRHAVSLADAAGLTIVALGVTLVAEQVVRRSSARILGGGGGACRRRHRLGARAARLRLRPDRLRLRRPRARAGVPRRRRPGPVHRPARSARRERPVADRLADRARSLAGVLLVIGLRPRQDLPPEPPVRR